MTIEEVRKYCESLADSVLDMPFDEKVVVFRHKSNRKIFLLFCPPDSRPSMTVKCEPMQADFYRSVYGGVIAGYHMNKLHWNTVYLDSDVPENEIFSMIDQSFDLTKPKIRKRK
jgi:predicted DNA-binding protein (MmcQ/YjbR family)